MGAREQCSKRRVWVFRRVNARASEARGKKIVEVVAGIVHQFSGSLNYVVTRAFFGV